MKTFLLNRLEEMLPDMCLSTENVYLRLPSIDNIISFVCEEATADLSITSFS